MGEKVPKAVSKLQRGLILRIGGEKFQPFIELYLAWKPLVGDLLAAKSHPFRFQKSILYIAVENNSWLQELVLRKADILSKCRSRIPDLRDIIFFIRS